MRKIFLSLFYVIIATLAMFAGNVKITGRVLYAKDSTNVFGATVKLLNEHHTILGGTTTDVEGNFILASDIKDAVNIEISFIGFLTVSIQVNGGSGLVSLGDIYLIEDVKTLGEVTVSGSLQKVNRHLLFPNKTQIKASQDIITLLNNLSLSGLSVDLINKAASIHGKPIRWMINGVPHSLQEVKNIKPESILRIDYSETPSMRELDRGYGGSINIILKDKTDGGSVATHLQSALWVGFVNASASVDYHKSRSEFTVDYNSSYRNYPRWNKEVQQKYVGDDFEIVRDEMPEDSPFKSIEHNVNLTYVYQSSNKRLYSATWRNTFGLQNTDVRNKIVEVGKNLFHRETKSKFRDYTPAIDLFMKNEFENGGSLEANIVGTISSGKSDRDLIDKGNEAENRSYSNPAKTHYHSIIGELVYGKSIHRKAYLSLGLQDKYAYGSNKYLSPKYFLDELTQNNLYLYGQLSGSLTSTLQYSLGTGAKVFYINDNSDSKSYFKNQSSLGIYYSPTSSFMLSFNGFFVPNLPSLSQLSSVVQQFDDLSVYTGNKDLKPSYSFTNFLYAGYRRGQFNSNLTLRFDYTTDPIFTEISYQPSKGYFLFQSSNGHYNRQYGAEWKVTYQDIFNFLSLFGTIGFNRYESNVGDNPLHLNNLYWDVSSQMVYKDFVFSMFYAKSQKSLYNEIESYEGDRCGLTLMWNKGNWAVYTQMIYVGLKDGDSYFTTNHSKVNPYTTTVKIPENGNMLTLGLVWNMDFGKQKNKINRSLRNSDSNESVLTLKE
ncbi:outer membrane beta-barrel protein [Falsiporphyromonas endometrii]|uniref:Outer membrane beta-barrel protein n=1 Tax=Falsiporphyromonas endometrii TaxID=1387297 RepID=A0ABV9K650_9PORP